MSLVQRAIGLRCGRQKIRGAKDRRLDGIEPFLEFNRDREVRILRRSEDPFPKDVA
jgi:hypothetical protein